MLTNRHHWLITIVVALLPLSYVPHEIVNTGLRVVYVETVLVVVAAACFGVFRGRPRPVEVVAAVLVVWVVARLLVIAPLDTGSVEFSTALREVATVGAGVLLFRMAATPELRPAIVRGLRIALAVMLVVEAYQLLVGLPTLLNLGYVPPEFNYNTAAGTYRPFGTLQSPVVFGSYLAVVGLAVVLTSRRWVAAVASVATVAGLAFTETRSAWIGFGVGMVVAFLLQPRAARSTRILVLVPAAWALGLAALIAPAFFLPFVTRLDSVTDTSDTSASIRLDLWQGTLRAATHRPVDGYGAADFGVTMRPYVGALSDFGHPHNTYLQVLYLYGAVAVVLFVALLGAMMWQKQGAAPDRYRAAGIAAVAAYMIGAFFESTWTSSNTVMTLFLVAGLAATGRPAEGHVEAPQPPTGTTVGMRSGSPG